MGEDMRDEGLFGYRAIGRNLQVKLRVNANELEALRVRAEIDGIDVSCYLRRLIRKVVAK